jgi:hypothetical protein
MQGFAMTKKCGAKTRSGEPCKNNPLIGKTRCKLHGGRSTGSPSSATNAIKHGIYAKKLSPAERIKADELQSGSVDDELTLCRILLGRALQKEKEHGAKLELYEVTCKPGEERQVLFKRRDHADIVDRLVGRIASLEKTRARLLGMSGGGIGLPLGFEVIKFDE